MCFDAVKRFRFPRVFPQGERRHGICRVWEGVMVAERYASNLRHRSTGPETSPAFSPTNLATSSPILKPTFTARQDGSCEDPGHRYREAISDRVRLGKMPRGELNFCRILPIRVRVFARAFVDAEQTNQVLTT